MTGFGASTEAILLLCTAWLTASDVVPRAPEQVTIPSNTPRPNGGLVASDRGGCGFPGARN